MPTSEKINILLGPTAVGKTAVSIPLARSLDAEIISADSRQVYIGLDIGTAKPTAEERDGIPHHLIDIVPPDADFTVADFQRVALEKIHEILSREKEPLVVGGTGLYIRALTDRPGYQNLPPIPELRKEILAEIKEKGTEAVYKELEKFDPDAAERIHPNNIPRLVRAMEVIRATGRRFSEAGRIDQESKKKDSPYSWRLVGLNMKRELLYERIDRRVLKMIDEGWVDEVRHLLDEGLTGNEKPLTGLGYRDIVAHVRGEKTLDEAAETIQRDTRRFAKRQLTFFRGMPGIEWINLEPDFDPEKIAMEILSG